MHCFNLALMVGIPDKGVLHTELWIKTMQQQNKCICFDKKEPTITRFKVDK